MSTKRILLSLVLAFLLSGTCCWVMARKLSSSAGSKGVPDVAYVVAAQPISPGEAIKPESIQLLSWPGNRPIDGGNTRIADVAGREALFPLAKGEPILERHLSAPGSGMGLASKIPDGMRAVTLRSDEVVGVAGFLIPGSHLDVLVTYHTASTPDPLTATVLQNVVAIAAGHEIQPDPAGKPSDVTIVTLLLTPDDVQRAVLASGQGQIHFVLRNGADQTISGSAPVVLSQLAGRPRLSTHPTRGVVKLAVAEPSIGHEIETVLAGEPQRSGVSR